MKNKERWNNNYKTELKKMYDDMVYGNINSLHAASIVCTGTSMLCSLLCVLLTGGVVSIFRTLIVCTDT